MNDEHILKLCCSMNTTYISRASLTPRHFPPLVLQATAGGGEDLGMRLLLCEMYVSAMKH